VKHTTHLGLRSWWREGWSSWGRVGGGGSTGCVVALGRGSRRGSIPSSPTNTTNTSSSNMFR